MKTEILKAITEGRDVQYTYFDDNDSWVDFYPSNVDADYSVYASLFNDTLYCRWRIKPAMREISCKSALMDHGSMMYVLTVNTAEEAIELETNSTSFVKWLTNWVTYRVER